MSVITRFAPSPTGHLHIGGLRTALFNYLYAKNMGGKFLLRIEDTDLNRNSQEATEAIIEAFKWVGIDYDGELVYQSKRFDIYKSYIQKLLDEGKAYYCYMTKEELDTLRESQKQNNQTPRYDNRYRDFDGTPPSGISPVVRIKSPLEGKIEFSDGIKGEMSFCADEIDDFIIARSDGSPTYNFVVAIDDALMGVNNVIRGDDHLTNTPKQIVIYNALNFNIPNFFHVPMILGSDGKKLSKRHGATSVIEYKDLGFLPHALLNFLVRLGWSYGDKEIFSMEEMISLFSPKDLNTSPSQYNAEKLLWINNHYIRNLDSKEAEKILLDSKISLEKIKNQNLLLKCLSERCNTIIELTQSANEILNPPTQYDEKLKSSIGDLSILEDFIGLIGEENLQEVATQYIKQKNIKQKDLMQPLRLALLGKSGGIGIWECIEIIGTQESKNRIKTLIETIKS